VKRLVLAVAMLLWLGASAWADDVVTYRTSGAAPGDSADDKVARTTALDEAFKDATRRALDDLAAPDAVAKKAGDVETEVVRRARLWVSSFKVVQQTYKNGSLTVQVDVKIDTAKMRDRLVELGVEVGGGTTVPPPDRSDSPRTVTLLLRVTTVEGAIATYGADQSDRVPGAADAETTLGRRGLSTLGAPATGAAARAGEGLPLSDDDARRYGSDVGAMIVVIAGVEQGAPGPVRGAKGVACLSRAHVRVVAVATGAVVGEAQTARGATGTGAAQVSAEATRTALLEAIALAVPRVDPVESGPALALPAAKDGEVLVRVRGATGAQTAAVETYLSGAQGVKSVRLRRLGAGEVVLSVRGQRAERVGALVRGAADLGAKARVDGDAVEVTLP
jgi:hypothetical protein